MSTVELKVKKRSIESLKYCITTGTSSTEALLVFKYNTDVFDLIVTDMAQIVRNVLDEAKGKIQQ